MKKVLIGLAAFLSLLLVLAIVIYIVYGESKPKVENEEITQQIYQGFKESLHYDAYDTIQIMEFEFMGERHYIWKKKEHTVEATFGETRVEFNTKTQQGQAYQNGKELMGQEEADAIQSAIDKFNNDSFWLAGCYKLDHEGVELGGVRLENGPGLLATFTTGGSTPGDSYLWVLNKNYGPKSWKLWTSKIPIGGIEFTVTKWKKYMGAWFPMEHEGPLGLKIKIKMIRVE